MALCRDVPFSRYGDDKCAIMASENLVAMPGYRDFDVLVGDDGKVDPARQLFRAGYVGVDKGPHVSQFLLKDFSFDSLTVSAKQETFVESVDYMTDYDTWLFIQAGGGNGGVDDAPEETDEKRRYIRNARDLARLTATDAFYGEAFRAMHILITMGVISGNIGPYSDATRQFGFTTFGMSHLFKLIGQSETFQRNSWYQKWNVHRFLRPEAMAGLVHHTLTGTKEYPLHESLLDNDTLMNKIGWHNDEQNHHAGETYLLPMTNREGSPAHPSYPAGHSVSNGAYATILKAFIGFEKGEMCFTDPVVPDDDGTHLEAYYPLPDEICINKYGETVNGLTLEGEINKMATNVAFGRSMMGVHFRCDNTEGMHLGEVAAIRMLQQELKGLPEANASNCEDYPTATWKLRLFRGDVIAIYPDGSYVLGDEAACHKPYTGGQC
ncbi:unnamed protein product [Discosporangium mesarthrocarpum]